MPHTAPADAPTTAGPRTLRCRRPARSGHRAVAGELAALAFRTPATTPAPAGPEPARPSAVPAPRPAAD